VNRVVRGNEHRVDIFAFQQLSVIVINVRIFEGIRYGLAAVRVGNLDLSLHPVASLGENVRPRSQHHVVLRGLFADAEEVVHADAKADTDNTHSDAIIRADHPAVEGAWFCPYTGVLSKGAAATAAATVAVFLMKSRRGSPAEEGLRLFSIRISISISLQLWTKRNTKKFGVNCGIARRSKSNSRLLDEWIAGGELRCELCADKPQETKADPLLFFPTTT